VILHLLDQVFRAGTWRAFHGVSPLVALVICLMVAGVMLALSRRWW
jgi:hypothetical protein